MIDSTPLKNFVDAVILAVTFVFNATVLDADWMAVSVAVGGSVSGSVILAYFRRDARRLEQCFKVLASSIGGLVLGTVLQEYFTIANPAYRLGLFFMCSMLALVVLRALLNFTEKNAVEILRDTLQRFLNLKTPYERGRRRRPADGDKHHK